jgi:hypothetical protein
VSRQLHLSRVLAISDWNRARRQRCLDLDHAASGDFRDVVRRPREAEFGRWLVVISITGYTSSEKSSVKGGFESHASQPALDVD